VNEQQRTPEWTVTPLSRHVAVWPHTLGEFEKFPDAVATVADNGALHIWRQNPTGAPDRNLPPLKVYAPGYWATVEHVGDWSELQPPLRTPAERIKNFVNNYSVSGEKLASLDPRPDSTQELPPVPADPFEELDPDKLAETNGDVSRNSGVGHIPPYPTRAGEGPEEPGEGVVSQPPKAGMSDDTEESPDTDMSVALFVLGDWWGRLLRWRPERLSGWFRGAARSRRGTESPTPAPTHSLSPDQRKSYLPVLVSSAAFCLGLLTLTQMHL
jgi:hypothetical protein